MVCVPDLMAASSSGMIDAKAVRAVQTAIIGHCELMGDRMAILDAPPGLKPQEVKEWRVNAAGYDSKYAALYYPWIKVCDPVDRADGQSPCRPAGTWPASGPATTRRAACTRPRPTRSSAARSSLECNITTGEQDLLNPDGVNCIRAFPGRGIRVWGARTLSQRPVLALHQRPPPVQLRREVDRARHAVGGLRAERRSTCGQRDRRNVTRVPDRAWRDGALFGATPEQAFYVKCDAETNPPETIDAGQVIVEIGIAPVKPAEFVIFRITQLPTGGSGH